MTAYEVQMENLTLAKDAHYNELASKVKVIEEKLRTIFEDEISVSGVQGYELTAVSIGYIEICKDRKRIELQIDKRWDDNDCTNLHRVLQINVPSYGSFTCSDLDKVEFHTFVGRLASRLEKLTELVFSIEEWEEYDKIRDKYDFTVREMRNLKTREENRIQEEKIKEIEGRLVAGCKIIVGADVRYNHKNRIHLADSFRVLEVEKVTPKCIFFKGCFQREKKEDVIHSLMLGIIKHGFSFDGDVTVEEYNAEQMKKAKK